LELKVHETKKRSLAKAISFRAIEIAIDTLIFSFFIPDLKIALGLALVVEGICFGLHFGFERIWNRINYGRTVYKRDCEQAEWTPYGEESRDTTEQDAG